MEPAEEKRDRPDVAVPIARGAGETMAGDIFAALAQATACNDWSASRRPMVRRNCEVHFLRSGKFRLREIVLKIYSSGSAKPELAGDLFARSQVCHAAATAANRVPEPVFASHEHNAWAMERILVPTVGRRLKFGFPAAATRDGIARAAGSWLGWFYGCSGGGGEAPFDAAEFLRKLGVLRDKTASNDPAVLAGDGFLRSTLALADEVARGLNGMALPHVSVHGDFTPFNLFQCGGEMVGFDFLVHRRLPVCYDICRFLMYLDLYRLAPAPAAEARKYGCRQRDFEAFAAGYSGDLAWAGGDRWRQFQYLELARRLTSLALRRSEGRRSWFGRLENARVRRTVRLVAEGLG